MKLKIDAETLASQVSADLLFDVRGTFRFADESIILRIAGLDRPNGVSIRCWSGLALAFANIEIDHLAAPLLQTIAAASTREIQAFLNAKAVFESLGIVIEYSPDLENEESRVNLRRAGLSLTAKMRMSEDEVGDTRKLANSVAVLLLALLPVEDQIDSISSNNVNYDVEGEKRTRLSNWYERSRKNRALAILMHGYSCVVCGFNFEKIYGNAAAGLVEVHHLTPVHLMKESRQVNPETELVPLCSNCHSVAHRIDPPYTPQQISNMISDSSREQD